MAVRIAVRGSVEEEAHVEMIQVQFVCIELGAGEIHFHLF